MRRPAWLVAALLLSCQQRAASDLTSQLLFTASGSYDAQADMRTRQGQGVRSVQWRTRPPVPAQEVIARYDSDARSVSWQLTIRQAAFKLGDLKETFLNVLTPAGPGKLFTSGRLKGVLVYGSAQEWTLLTHPYAEQHAPAYAAAFHLP